MTGIQIRKDAKGIEIVRPWFNAPAIFPVGVALLAGTYIYFASGGLGGPGGWLIRVFAVIAAGLGYYAMCVTLNRSHIVIREGWISVSHGPLPTFSIVPDVSLEMSRVQELSVLRRWHGGGGQRVAASSFDVYAVTHDRHSVRLVQGASSLEEAEAIKKQIEGQLARSKKM